MKYDSILEIKPTGKSKCVNCKQNKPVHKCFVGERHYEWSKIQTAKKTCWCRECWKEAQKLNNEYKGELAEQLAQLKSKLRLSRKEDRQHNE